MNRTAADAFVHEYLPPPSGGDAVTLLLLHGSASEAFDLLRVGPRLDEGAGLLAPRGRVLEDGEPRFFRRGTEGGHEDDRRVRTVELADWLRAAAKHHRFDPRRVVAVGHRNGADMATSLLAYEPELLEAAVLFRPALHAPERVAALRGRAVFIAAGRTDPGVPAPELERFAQRLRSAGADVVLHWDNAGSMPDRREIAAARTWLARRNLARGLRVHDPPL